MAKVLGTFYTGTLGKAGTAPTSPPDLTGVQPYPVNPPGSGNTTLYKLLGDVTDQSFVGKNGRVPVVNSENVLTLEPLPQVQENGLISGGLVQWTGIGYIFNVSSAFYRIGGVAYESPPVQITLATPDVTNGRIDVFAVSTGSVALAITGTPSGTPVKPQINPQTQLELTSVIVGASTTIPTLTTKVIYDQNIEWVGSKTGTGTVVFNSTASPFQGTLSIEATNIENDLKIRLTDTVDYNLSLVQTLGMQLKLKAALWAGQNIGVTFLNSAGSAISTELILNLDKSLLTYQFIGIALNQFSFTSFLARAIEFRYIRTKGTVIYSGLFLDIIKLEGGINPPLGVSSFLGLSDTPNTYLGQGGKVVSVKADASGLEFVTAASGGGGSSNAFAETPSGLVNSANLVYTLANTPADTDGVLVLLNGVTQYNGIDYSVSGATITFTVAPVTGSSIFAYYNTFTASGGIITRSITSASVNTTAGGAASTDYVYFVTGTTTITLPTAVGNTNRYTIKSVSGVTTVACNGLQTIDGSATIGIAVEDSVDLISNNTEWKVV